MRPRKVAFIINGFLEGWLEPRGLTLDDFCNRMIGSWFFNYLEAVQGIGIEAVLIAMANVSQPSRRIHEPTGAPMWILPAPRINRWALAADARTFRRLNGTSWRLYARTWQELSNLLSTPLFLIARTLRREACDAIMVQEYETIRFDLCVAIGHAISTPVFGMFTAGHPQAFLRPLRRRSLANASGLIICAQREVDRVRTVYRLPERKVLKLSYPIDRRFWFPEDKTAARSALGLKHNAIIAIYHGEIDFRMKGVDILIRAWEQITRAQQKTSLQLLILGAGNDAEALAQWLRRTRRSDVIFRREWITDRTLIRRYLSACDLYVFPTRDDAVPLSITEAMACGLPVITGSGQGIQQDIFPEGPQSGGLVVPSGDAAAFALALARMLNDRDFRLKLADRARHRMADACFDSTTIAREFAGFVFARRAP